MKKYIGFVSLCLLICILPFAGMVVAPTNTTTENKTLASFPEIKKNGKWNTDWLSEAGSYFEDHFAFRSYLVTADSEIQSKIFGVSNMDTVIYGEDGWLYYTATLDDYLGNNTMSERGINNVAHNLSLFQQYIEEKGATFMFTIAPNKNSIYGDAMPYYNQKKVSEIKNITLLEPLLEKMEISYVDLFSLFQEKNEILYLKRDSHWNQKGAVLVYDALMNALNLEHDNFETVSAVRTKTEYGDLNRMLYPKSAVPEWNYAYKKESDFQYITDTESVEDAWIQTENKKGQGSLLMFRDSFGNTLLPLMADVFEQGYFSKSTPYLIESYLNEYNPNIVIVEKVERNLRDFATDPPIMTGLSVSLRNQPETIETETSLQIEECEYDTSYWEISGVLDARYVDTDTKVYIQIKDGKKEKTYEAFTVSTEKSDNGYLLYLPKYDLSSDNIDIYVITETDEKEIIVKEMGSELGESAL